MPVITCVLIAKLYIHQSFWRRCWVTTIVGKVIAFWFTISIGDRSVSLVPITIVTYARFRIDKVIMLIDIRWLIMVSVGTLTESIIFAIGSIFHAAILKVNERIPVVVKVVISFEETAVIELTSVRRIILIILAVRSELVVNLLVFDISKISEVITTELLEIQATHYIPAFIFIVEIVDNAVGVL